MIISLSLSCVKEGSLYMREGEKWNEWDIRNDGERGKKGMERVFNYPFMMLTGHLNWGVSFAKRKEGIILKLSPLQSSSIFSPFPPLISLQEWKDNFFHHSWMSLTLPQLTHSPSFKNIFIYILNASHFRAHNRRVTDLHSLFKMGPKRGLEMICIGK